ncbi:RNA polymerase sigma factor [Xanthomarina sp.]|uniref:RNA polymerase sigma factor n=1 Tax=Xanthomarina sp. TaxID=1931211 RepID=UPI002CE527EA|nr:RNA polymerase sigma factor [Xanthomarina sp.]HLV39498.1 RNA polymerase sigma factor [Xanthomarina sp.]
MEAININDFNKQKIKEEELVTRILKGEKELYEILVRRNNQKLYRVIRGYLTDEAEIEDAMQNSYIKAYTKLYQFKQNAAFSTWLIRIGINEALARIKEKGKLYQLWETPEGSTKNSILELPDSKQLNPQDTLIQMETKQLLERAINQLDSKYKSVYIMKEVEEMNLKEIALVLDLTVANVKVRLHRAKTMLKETLYDMSDKKQIFEFGFGRCDRITEYVMKNI